MILLTNGCSWTYGGSLDLDLPEDKEKRLVSVWPHYLGKLMNAERVVNLAEGGGSNHRIVRTTFDWLEKQSEQDRQKTVAVFQLTSPPRFEYYEPVDPENHQENLPHRWARAKPGWVAQLTESDETAVNRVNHRSETLTFQEESYHFLQIVLALDSLCRRMGVAKYYLWSYQYTEGPFLNSVSNFYTDPRFPWLHRNADYPYAHWVYEKIGPDDQHPSFQGHRELAQIIFNHMERLDRDK